MQNDETQEEIMCMLDMADRHTRRNAFSFLLAITPESTLNQFYSYLCSVSEKKHTDSDTVKPSGRLIEVIVNGRDNRRSNKQNP